MELHIGYVYGSNKVPPHASYYTPKFIAGARLPHAWIRPADPSYISQPVALDLSYIDELSVDEKQIRQYSTLDLCGYDSFTLIVGERGKWASRVQSLLGMLEEIKVRIRLYGSDVDFAFVQQYHRSLFDDGASFNAGGGLLVRPDQHVLAKLQPEVTVQEMALLLVEHLGLSYRA